MGDEFSHDLPGPGVCKRAHDFNGTDAGCATASTGPENGHALDGLLGRKELRIFPCEHRRLVYSELRSEFSCSAAQVLPEGFDFIGRHGMLSL